MNKMILAVSSMLASVAAYAHPTDMPFIIHAIEHGWILLALLPLLFFLLPLDRMRRR